MGLCRRDVVTGEGVLRSHQTLCALDGDTLRLLQREERDMSRTASEQSGELFGGRIADRRITSPFRFVTSPGGQILEIFAEHLAKVWSSRVFSMLYLTYRVGDFSGFHTDRAECQWTHLYALTEASGLEVLLSTERYSIETLFEKARAGGGFIDECTPACLSAPGSGLRMHATTFGHQRRPTDREIKLASICLTSSEPALAVDMRESQASYQG